DAGRDPRNPRWANARWRANTPHVRQHLTKCSLIYLIAREPMPDIKFIVAVFSAKTAEQSYLTETGHLRQDRDLAHPFVSKQEAADWIEILRLNPAEILTL